MLLSVSNLTITIDDHVLLDKVSFNVEKGTSLAIIGPNGAGKTLLFKAILGLIDYQGEVKWLEKVKIGYVPQKVFVGKEIPLTVEEFMHLKEHSKKKIADSLKEVGKSQSILKTKLGSLSGGELQRVLIAFSLLGDPDILFFDEPTSGVDVAGEETVYALIHKLQKERGLTILFISHELEIVYKYATNVLCLNKEGICFGPPREAIDKESLEALYGEEVHFYKHH